MILDALSPTNQLLLAYVLAVAGLITGLRLAHAPRGKFLWTPVLAVPAMIGVSMLGSVIVWIAEKTFGALPPVITGLFGLVFFFVGSAAAAIVFARVKIQDNHQRGTRVVDSAASRASDSAGNSGLTFAGWSVPEFDETKHFKIMGTTGTGKSTAIRQLLKDALVRGDRAVIADPDGSYMETFYDPKRGDVILNPFHEYAARWDIFAEIILPHDADQLARSLIPDYEGSDRSWRGYARTFLTAVLRQMHRVNEHNIAKLYYLLVMASPEELRDLLESTPAGPFLGKDNGKYFDSVRSVAMAHLAALEHVARQESGDLVSVRKWIREGRGVLFLPYKAGEIAALRQIVSTWMRLAIFETMNVPAGDQRLWFAIDELDALGAIEA
jgi:type IV secretory pathway TraG/TraD family ATPase VirD4